MTTGRQGFRVDSLDRLLGGGLLPGTLTVVAGATGAGKTQLGLRWAQDTIWGGEPVAASDPKGGKRPECWPADLRIRQYPTTAGAVAA